MSNKNGMNNAVFLEISLVKFSIFYSCHLIANELATIERGVAQHAEEWEETWGARQLSTQLLLSHRPCPPFPFLPSLPTQWCGAAHRFNPGLITDKYSKPRFIQSPNEHCGTYCVTQLMLYTGDKLSSIIFCCL